MRQKTITCLTGVNGLLQWSKVARLIGNPAWIVRFRAESNNPAKAASPLSMIRPAPKLRYGALEASGRCGRWRSNLYVGCGRTAVKSARIILNRVPRRRSQRKAGTRTTPFTRSTASLATRARSAGIGYDGSTPKRSPRPRQAGGFSPAYARPPAHPVVRSASARRCHVPPAFTSHRDLIGQLTGLHPSPFASTTRSRRSLPPMTVPDAAAVLASLLGPASSGSCVN